MSRPRNAQQAHAVAGVARHYLHMKFDMRLFKRLPAALAAGMDTLKDVRVEP
jgi:hypothetical protein